MHGIGVDQLLKKKFKYLKLGAEFNGIMGDYPAGIQGLVYGESSQGKSSFCMQLAKSFCMNDYKVGWWSYEQGHSATMQRALSLNNMQEVSGLFIPINPFAKMSEEVPGEAEGDHYCRDLCTAIEKRNSPQIGFIDSGDYTEFTKANYKKAKRVCERKNRNLIWIAHGEGKVIENTVMRKIGFDGEFTIFVKDYVAYPVKSRLGGSEPYIIYPEKVKEINELNPKAYNAKVKAMISKLPN